MRSRKCRLAAFGALLATLLLCSGCTVSGGGWLTSLFGGGKATFAFSGVASESQFSGQGEYHDHSSFPTFPKGVDAHLVTSTNIGPILDQCGEFFFGTLEGCISLFEVPPAPATIFIGTYTPQPKTAGPGGSYMVFEVDEGQPHSLPGDFYFIAFCGGIYDRYVNCGYIQGGNISVLFP